MPKIAEINTICKETGRFTVYYEPEIVTEVQSDGTKVSKVVVKVFPDQANRDQFTVLDWDLFTD